MTSKVEVDARICAHKTIIEVTDKGGGTMAVHIRSECKDIRHFARLLPEVSPEDYTRWSGSRVWEMAEKAGLTTTCLIPVALINACWMEAGMISKRLALKEGAICVRFLE